MARPRPLQLNRSHQRPSCEGKRRYSQRAAQSAARRGTDATGHYIRAYRCEFGDHWHIGHAAPRWQVKAHSGHASRR